MGTVSGSQPYPWPYHGALVPRQTALLACLDPQWRIGRPQDRESDERLVQLSRTVRSAGGLVVAITATTSHTGRTFLNAGTKIETTVLKDMEPDVKVKATGTSGFLGSPLDRELRNRKCVDLLVAGWGLEGPVHSTLRAANDRGFECLLVADASTSVDTTLAFAADQMVCFSGGIFGAIARTSDVLAAYGRGQTDGSIQ
jgi:nicotinamidase-related amidase